MKLGLYSSLHYPPDSQTNYLSLRIEDIVFSASLETEMTLTTGWIMELTACTLMILQRQRNVSKNV